MDITEFFKAGFKNLQKELIDKNYRKKSLQARKESLINARRQTRDTLRFNYRKIDLNNMSPLTPIVPTNEHREMPLNKATQIKKVVNSKRFEMLKQWKEKKLKIKQEEKKQFKPIFKVFHVEKLIGLPDLQKVNKEIKGKPIKPLKNELPKSFAPSHHKFIAPKSVKPIHFNKQPILDKPKVNKNTSNLTRKILPKTNSRISIKSAPNVTNNAKKILRNTSAGIKKVQPSINSNNQKRCVPVAGTSIRTNTRTATSTIGKSNMKKGKIDSKKTNKVKVVGELNTEENKFKTPESQFNTPKDKYEAKSLKFQSPFITPKNEYQAKSLSKREITPWIKSMDKDSNSLLSGEKELKEKSVIIIDDSLDDLVVYVDSEVTMKTPIKKNTPSRSSRYTPRPLSSRKSYAKKDSCILCLDSPIVNTSSKTPTTKSKNQTSRTKTPNTETETPIAKTLKTNAKTPKINTNTPKTKSKNKTEAPMGKTPKYKRKSDRNDMEITVSTDSEEFANNVTKTPNSEKYAPIYVSPFVTITRGKDSARKEYQIRKSTGGTLTKLTDGRDFTDTTSTRAGAEYFEQILGNEVTRIESICDKWEKYKVENEIAEETSDMINVATGQSRLLISKKFEQFRGLINQCKLYTFEEKHITCEDLHGFWDMIYQQVLDLGRRFDHLDRLKDNNWEEILPEKKVIKKKVKCRPKKHPATSSLKDIIKAAKNKNKQDAWQSVIKEPITPENMKITSPIKGNSSRRSLRVSLLQGRSLRRVSSPGLTMMKISQTIKAGDGLTPGKSILKTDLTKSAKRHTKSVLFIENVIPKKVIFSPENNENNPKQANLNNGEEVPVTSRMSLRSSKKAEQS